jgi:hypothetical protein
VKRHKLLLAGAAVIGFSLVVAAWLLGAFCTHDIKKEPR